MGNVSKSPDKSQRRQAEEQDKQDKQDSRTVLRSWLGTVLGIGSAVWVKTEATAVYRLPWPPTAISAFPFLLEHARIFA